MRGRDNQLTHNLRLIAASTKFPSKRRLSSVDMLAELAGVYFTEPTGRQYVEPAARAKILIVRLLKRLLREDRKSAAVLDRLVFIQGQEVQGLFRSKGDPLAKEPNKSADSDEVAAFLQKIRGDHEQKHGEAQAI
ncbi:MAG: hypothetical protein WCC04_05730 [Terriglobales bacterium]